MGHFRYGNLLAKRTAHVCDLCERALAEAAAACQRLGWAVHGCWPQLRCAGTPSSLRPAIRPASQILTSRQVCFAAAAGLPCPICCSQSRMHQCAAATRSGRRETCGRPAPLQQPPLPLASTKLQAAPRHRPSRHPLHNHLPPLSNPPCATAGPQLPAAPWCDTAAVPAGLPRAAPPI